MRRSTERGRPSRSARIGQRRINSSTRRSTPRRSDIVASSKPDGDRPTPVSWSLPSRAARRRSNLSADQVARRQHAGSVSGLGPTFLLIAPGKHELVWPKRSTKRPIRNDSIFIAYLMRKSHTRSTNSASKRRLQPDVLDQSLENHRAGTIFGKGRPYVRITTIPLFYGLFGDALPKIRHQRYSIGQLC